MTAHRCPSLPPFRSRVIASAALLLCGGFMLSGCSWIGNLSGRPPQYREVFEISLSASQTVAHPGESFIVHARLSSVGDKPVRVRAMNADSVTFYWNAEGSPERLIRRPVASPLEDLSETELLAPGQPAERDFLFTDVTPATGTFGLVAIYRSPVKGRSESPMAAALPVEYRVEGDRRFVRGPDGVISKEDAIAVARELLARPTVYESAALIRNEMGFFDWYVALTPDPQALAPGEPARRAFYVNPYLGVARMEAPPDLAEQVFAEPSGPVIKKGEDILKGAKHE
jgi:hypothetical protein